MLFRTKLLKLQMCLQMDTRCSILRLDSDKEYSLENTVYQENIEEKNPGIVREVYKRLYK